MRRLLLALAVFLPQPLKQAFYRRAFGWRIGKHVRIGLSYLDARQVDIGDYTRIGHLNVMHHIGALDIGPGVWIGNFNYVLGSRTYDPRHGSALIVGEQARWTSHHYVDASGTAKIGRRTVLAGRGTQIWTHSFIPVKEGFTRGVMETVVGDGCYVGSRSTLLGCDIPDGSVVGAGSVVTKRFPAEEKRLLIAGNPAAVKKRYDFDSPMPGESNV